MSPERRQESVRESAAAERAWELLRANAQNPDILALRHETALRLTQNNARELRPVKWLATAAILLLMVGGVILATRPAPTPQTAGMYATGTGQQLPINLPDGSHVTLDTLSELQVAFSDHERSVRLVRGQALFEVAKDSTRPFVVTAGDHRLEALGTVFDVHLNEQQVRVTMVEGTVRVARAVSTPPPEILITAGEQLISDDPQHDRVYEVNPKQVTSWLHGQVIFDNTSLAAAVTELNRYSALQIKLADPGLAAIHLSGTFTADRPDLFVEAVTTYYPISIASADSRLITLKSR